MLSRQYALIRPGEVSVLNQNYFMCQRAFIRFYCCSNIWTVKRSAIVIANIIKSLLQLIDSRMRVILM